jgi:ubiquinone/menaquinone biosynthesis C-methylase UbiE
MVGYARTQAQERHVDERVTFRVMDALLRLEFPDGYFDLVNIRFGSSFLRTWDWSKLLQEFHRVGRSGAIIRVTDGDIAPQSNSVAQQELCGMIICAMERSGHLFTTESTGVTTQLASLLTLHGYQKVQTKAYAFDYQGGTADGQAYRETSKYAFQTLRPFLQKYGCDNNNYEALCQQALEDMQRSDFKVTQNYLTAWGKNPPK